MNKIKDESKIVEEIGMTRLEGKKKKGKKKNILNFTPDKIIAGIIYSEILGKPKGRKRLVLRNESKGSNSR